MSDANKYVNAYIDTSVGMINEMTIKYLQSQAQLKVASEIVAERDNTISALQNELHNQKQVNSDNQKSLSDAKIWEDSYNAMKSKLSHMDTLMNQMGQMKLRMQEKDEEIKSLQSQIIELTTGKQVRVKKKRDEVVEEKIIETVNDF